MQISEKRSQKSLLINLFVFYIFYFALILTERQLVRKGFLSFQLPFKVDIMETIVGFVLGTLIIFGATRLLKNRDWIVRLILVTALLLGTIFINYFLYRFYYPQYSVISPGNLQELGDERWKNDYSFEMFSGLYDNYYLLSVVTNPNIENYKELSRAVRFGVYWRPSKDVPAEIDQNTYQQIEKELGDHYLEIKDDTGVFRLYAPGESDQILLTRYEDMILFLPMSVITK